MTTGSHLAEGSACPWHTAACLHHLHRTQHTSEVASQISCFCQQAYFFLQGMNGFKSPLSTFLLSITAFQFTSQTKFQLAEGESITSISNGIAATIHYPKDLFERILKRILYTFPLRGFS